MLRIIGLLFLLAFPVVAQGQTFSGELVPSLARRAANGATYQDHAFMVGEPREIIVNLKSQDFDTYLILISPSGVTTENDDFGGRSVSQLQQWALETGQWVVRASAYSQDEYGAYAIEVVQGEAVEMDLTSGRLDGRDDETIKGERYDRYDIVLDEGDRVLVEARSMGYDGFLTVKGPDGRYQRNDDAVAGDTTLSRIGPLSTPGEYAIFVTSLRPERLGAYDLRLVAFESDYVGPSIATTTSLPLMAGYRVVRGPDWKWGDQGGNSVATVQSESEEEAGWWNVTWDNGESYAYRWGAESAYDMAVISPVDVSTLSPGSRVRIRADIAAFEGSDTQLHAAAGEVVEVVSVLEGNLVLRLGDDSIPASTGHIERLR